MKKLSTRFLMFLLAVCFILPMSSLAGDKFDIKDVKKTIPAMLGANNVGKEFWFSIPPCYEDESYGFANFIKLFITSPVKTLVTVEVPGNGYFKARNTIPDDVIEFNITPVQASCWTKNGQQTTPPDAVYKGKSLHIYADQPVVVYCVVRYHWTSDGWLCYPISSCGREYIASTAQVDPMFNAWGYKLPTNVTVAAGYDDTKVRFSVGGNVLTVTSGGMKAGDTKEWNLMKGDVLMVSTEVAAGDLSGSKIVSTKPIGVVSGNFCSNIPIGNQWCDYTAEMDIPTYTWGLDVHVGKVPNRKFSSMVKIMGKEPNTKLYRNGNAMGAIQTSGGIEGKGFLYMRMTPDMKPGSIVISGDKPITASLYNGGVQEDGYPAVNSDPFVMACTPVQQYQKEITFCTPGIMGGQNFNENYVNLVYECDANGMMPDHIEFAGPVHGGAFSWVRLNTKFAGIDELFRKDVNGKKYALKTIVLPGDGVYKIRSQTPFAAYSFGYSDYDSYGMPTSAALADLEKPDTVAPVPTWTIKCDGNVTDGVVTDMPEDKTVRSNLSMIVFHSDFSYNYEFKYVDFIPGDTRTTNWTLAVIDPSQDGRAIITFTDRRGNDTTIQIDYFATKLTINPSPINYGNFKTGESKTLDFWAVNFSEQSSATVKDLKLKSGNTGFTLTLPKPLPWTIGPKDSVKFTITFTATAEGKFEDSVGLGDNCIFFNKARILASVGNPIIFVDDCPFDILSVGKTQTKDFHVTNEGNVPLVITGYTGPSLSVYTTSLPTIDNANPLVLKPKESQTFQITFKPTTVNKFPDQIVFTNDAGTNRKNVCIISGESMQPGLRANSFDWHERRIDRNGKPAGPYDPDNGYQVIKFINDGSEDVYISQYNIVTDNKGAAFEFDRNKIQGLSVPKQDSVIVPVKFHPTQVGLHELVLSYENSAGINVSSRLVGVGILPRIATYDYDFDTTTIQVLKEKQTRKIVFKNVPYTVDTVCSDAVTITGFKEVAASDIGTDGVTFNPNAWTYNKSALTFPIKLIPGDSIEFDADFVAQVPGGIKASLTSVSDAETEATSNWTGYGVSQLIRSTGGTATTCIGNEAIISCTVENYGSTDIEVTSLELQPPLGYVYFKNTNDAQGFTLKAFTPPKTILIGFDPSKAGTDNINLVINSNAQGMEKITSPIVVTGVDYSRAAKLHTSIFPDANKNGRPTPGADNINVSVTFDGAADLSLATVDSVYLQIEYNGGITQYINGSAKIGAMAQGWTIARTDVKAQAGTVTFILTAPANQHLNGAGEILKLSFATYLPTSKVLTDMTPLKVIAGNADLKNKCLTITPDSTSIKWDQTCAYDLRNFLVVTGQAYALSAINPNPVGSSGATLNFSVGLDGYTNIEMYNTMGEKVKTLFNGNAQAGAYQIQLPVEDINSGLYWIRMQSGQFNDEKQLIISK